MVVWEHTARAMLWIPFGYSLQHPVCNTAYGRESNTPCVLACLRKICCIWKRDVVACREGPVWVF